MVIFISAIVGFVLSQIVIWLWLEPRHRREMNELRQRHLENIFNLKLRRN